MVHPSFTTTLTRTFTGVHRGSRYLDTPRRTRKLGSCTGRTPPSATPVRSRRPGPSSTGRSLRRSLFTPYLERVKGYHETEAYRKAMRKRGVWVEPLFGEAKDWHGLRRFRLRGLWKVNCEGLLVAAGQNLKRWLSKTGWGRRHGPAGSLALSHLAPFATVGRPGPC